MYWLVETKDQLREFFYQDYKEVFVEIIPYHNQIHPALNDVCLVYVRPTYDSKGYMFCIEFQNGITLFDYTEMSINDVLYNSTEEFITALGL